LYFYKRPTRTRPLKGLWAFSELFSGHPNKAV